MNIKVKDNLSDLCSVYIGDKISGIKIDVSNEKCFIVCGGQAKEKIPLSSEVLVTGSKDKCIEYCQTNCKEFEIL